MTTNVIDLAAGLVASDSRWSTTKDGKIHYVDDTSFDKIAVCDEVVMICAGDAELIGRWRDWLAKPSFYHLATPETEIERDGEVSPIYVALVTRPEGELVYCKGVYWFVDGTFMFTGSGGEHARACYTANKDIDRCIETATRSDDHTGGTVRRVNVATGESNLADPPKGVQDITDSYNQRGFIMDLVTRTKTSVVLAEVAANELAVQGKQMHFSAPTGQPAAPWTRDDHVRLGKALQVIADKAERRANK